MELRLEHASFSNDGFRMSDISLSIDSGITLLTGACGSGKTTLLMMLSSLVPLESGFLMLDSARIVAHDSRIGIIFQFPERQLFATTVISDTSYALRARGEGKKEAEEKARCILREMAIDENKWYESPFSLSGGERRRAAIAGILISEPDIVLMDEPTVGLDGFGYQCFLEILKKLKKQRKTVLIATHDEELYECSDRTIAMENGRIISDSPNTPWLLSLSERLATSCDISAIAKKAVEMLKERKL